MKLMPSEVGRESHQPPSTTTILLCQSLSRWHRSRWLGAMGGCPSGDHPIHIFTLHQFIMCLMNNTFFPHEHCCWQGSYLPFCIGPAGSPFFLLCLHHLVACLQQQVQAQSIPHDRFHEEKQPWVTERLSCASLLCPCLSGSMWPVPLPWPVCSTLILSAWSLIRQVFRSRQSTTSPKASDTLPGFSTKWAAAHQSLLWSLPEER